MNAWTFPHHERTRSISPDDSARFYAERGRVLGEDDEPLTLEQARAQLAHWQAVIEQHEAAS
jgi:hypothetical protein